jgi:tRNA pseudouridine38-40 synthase
MRYLIKLAYKGTDFYGWQRQPNAVTVQGEIEKAINILLKIPTEIVGCGRTDTGVHATDYYAHFDTEVEIDEPEFAYKLNALLPKTIAIYEVSATHEKFHTRFDAVSRTYQYYILLGNNPFTLDTSWQIPQGKFDLEAMNTAALYLMKHTDFQSFSKSKTDVKNYNCTISEAFWIQKENLLIFNIKANRFLRNMVRAIVGTLLDVGIGKITIKGFEAVILSKNRSEAGLSVPARGLFLSQVEYPSHA